MTRLLTRLTLAVVTIQVSSTGLANEAASRGEAIVDQWCRACHLRAGDRPDPDMAPPFEEIVTRPGRNRVFFDRFVRGDHFPMTMFRLFDDEKDDVVSYLQALKEQSGGN